MTTSSQNGPRTCPCKTVPWSLSSFTAAEYGDVQALLKRSQKSEHGNNDVTARTALDLCNRKDASGMTPLHLAAQHNHVAATVALLQLGANVEGSTSNTSASSSAPSATPLHRASFSGATATMRVLIQNSCQLLSQDLSFGDAKTPLHKAAAGGRYLAVELLLQALRDQGKLDVGLAALDADGKTPIEVAQSILPFQRDEQESVARWDQVAGGTADWSKCMALLEKASEEITVDVAARQNSSKDSLPVLPNHLSTLDGCIDCQTTAGMCLTAKWQSAFEAALGNAVQHQLQSSQGSPLVLPSVLPEPQSTTCTLPPTECLSELPSLPATDSMSHDRTSRSSTPSSSTHGMACANCFKQTISFHQVDRRLVCKSCKQILSKKT